LLPYGDVIDDFLDPLGISIQEFCATFTGSWMFGYARALREVGVNTVIICISPQVGTPVQFEHGSGDATICILPPTLAYRIVRRLTRKLYRRWAGPTFPDLNSHRTPLRRFVAQLRGSMMYLTTPPISLARALKRFGCDAIVCQEYEYPRFDVCVLIGRILRLPVFGTFQGRDYDGSSLERLFRPLAIRACTGLVIGPTAEMNRARRRYRIPSAKLAKIFNPIDLSVWHRIDQRTARTMLGIPSDARVIAWHGRVSKWAKGLDLLADAWARVCAEHTDVDLRLILIGSGEDAEWLRGRIEDAGLRGVHWHDAFVHDRMLMRTYLSAADAYAFPSRREGFAVALIEAMACGLGVVAADVSGVADVVEHGEESGGIIVPRENVAALTAGIWRLLSDRRLSHELGQRAGQRIETGFELKTVGRCLRAFFCDQHL
jgi:glycosyltransferase involved in cell wall biosynthesis